MTMMTVALAEDERLRKVIQQIERENERLRKKLRKQQEFESEQKKIKFAKGAKTSFPKKVNAKPLRATKIHWGGRGFALVNVVKKVNVKKTKHILRQETERLLDREPALILSSESDDITMNEAKERILAMHAIDEKKGVGKKQKYAYLELTGFFEDLNILRDYIHTLSKRYNTEVYAVIHTDESIPHAHVLLSWRNKEGKAIRLQKKDFHELWREYIKINQPSFQWDFKRGSGTKRVPFFILRNAWLKSEEEYHKVLNEIRQQRQIAFAKQMLVSATYNTAAESEATTQTPSSQTPISSQTSSQTQTQPIKANKEKVLAFLQKFLRLRKTQEQRQVQEQRQEKPKTKQRQRRTK